jgi:5-methylcytosine-specific restriction endonuclease McrA
MKERILAAKQAHPSWGYKRIADHTGLTKGQAAYALSKTRRDGVRRRTKQRRALLPLEHRVDAFIHKKSIRSKADDFQRRVGPKLGSRKIVFSYHDVLKKLGPEPTCYLTGRKLDWKQPSSYAFDHIVPAARGGTNELDNLGILCKRVNKMKHDLLPEEFIDLCKEVLIHAGFTLTAPWQNSNAPVLKTECG